MKAPMDRHSLELSSVGLLAVIVGGAILGFLLLPVAFQMGFATWAFSAAVAADEWSRILERQGRRSNRPTVIRNVSVTVMMAAIGWLAFSADPPLGLLAWSLGALPAFVFWSTLLSSRPWAVIVAFVVVFSIVVLSFVVYLAVRTTLPPLVVVMIGVIVEAVVIYDVARGVLAGTGAAGSR